MITASAAKRIFGLDARSSRGLFLVRLPDTPSEIETMLGDELRRQSPGTGTARGAPTAFRPAIVREPLFGVRTYAFTVDEALHLIREQQRSSTDRNLALVLPGGGVKAAYQTDIIDELYAHRYLMNEAVAPITADPTALPVRTVIGTSGGALLGYFVSQLPAKSIELFNILWVPDNRVLTSGDVFGFSDLLRYVSVVVSFAIFCFLLFLTSLHKGRAPGTNVFRWRLTLTVTLPFLLAPVFIRFVSGNDVEHIPEIEGIVYAIMALLVMAADQVLIAKVQPPAAPAPDSGTPLQESWRDRIKKFVPSLKGRLSSLIAIHRERRAPWYEVVLVSAGLFFTAIPLLGSLPFGAVVREPLLFNTAFATITFLVLGSTLAAVQAYRSYIDHPVLRGVETIGAIGAVLLLCAFGVMFPMQHILAGFALMLVASFDFWRIRYAKWKVDIQWLVTFVALYVIAALCWPEKHGPFGKFSTWFAGQESMRGISIGAFSLSIGFLLLIVAGAMWTYRTGEYEFSGDVKSLGLAMVILLGYAVATLGILVLLTTADWITTLELTLRFWIVLAVVSLGVGTLILIAAAMKKGSSFALAIDSLRGEHENGTLLQRRFSRMLVVAIVAVFWWNVVEAPGLYGNRIARDYHKGAIVRFNQARAHRRKVVVSFTPTARFIAPANLLQEDEPVLPLPSAQRKGVPYDSEPAGQRLAVAGLCR